MNNAAVFGLRIRSDTQKEPIAAIIGINMLPASLLVVANKRQSNAAWVL